ncbi:putative 2-aminoethylphosphonate ABC transporter permease subunit [Noviherbaspirillum cavernae]|uniref:Putative 2-aminoethylphosphonate ABC transporter permease subunit n=2 Tax=Noviherbaspirillum cavernae TaxID=2320862 RepID=A0A418WWF4_9BURK|nr:putative 2-aminoethylphosphonate ABC transporter permease subunit [Noviherbaspirillum cavernae]
MSISIGIRKPAPALVRSADEQIAGMLAWLLVIVLTLFIAGPLVSIFVKALHARDGSFAGFSQILQVIAEPRLLAAAGNSVLLALVTTAIVVPMALAFAFAMTRSRMAGRSVFRLIGLSPLLAPSLMPAISLVYLFGNQGILKGWLGPLSIYGFPGIVMGEVFYTFPHALLILTAALSVADARLYEAAEALGASRMRRFLTVTLLNARYGMVSAATLVFAMVVTDFGVPKVIGGQTNVLALEAYKQVIGQQNFNKGAVIGLLLLLPAVISFLVERRISRRQGATMTGKSVAYAPKSNTVRDAALWMFCAFVSVFLIALAGVAIAAAFMKLWPYNLSLTLNHFDFDQLDGGGWLAFRNSMMLSALTSVAGTGLVFLTAYLVAKLPIPRMASTLIRSLALLPMAVPGMVLGLGYVLFFNAPGNPLNVLYAGMTLLVASTVSHFHTTAYLTLVASLRQIDGEIEAVARSLQRPWWHTCMKVTLPMVVPSLLNVARYLFVSSMTTVSCVIFLYTPDTVLASVAVMNMDDAGDTAAAAAMASLIFFSSLAVSLLINAAGAMIERRTQRWRSARA